MNILDVIREANGRNFFRMAEPELVYNVQTRTKNHSGAIFEFEDLYYEHMHGPIVFDKGFGSLTLPRIIADDWEIIDEVTE